MLAANDIDIQESILRRNGNLLGTLLLDRTTKKNLIWATDSYQHYGKEFATSQRIKPELVTGIYSKLIQPRAAKSLAEQRRRTKDKGEVFTPLKVIDQINKEIDWTSENQLPDETNWKEYISELRLEITCGEAPFIVSRYNPTAHTGKLIKLENRVGFLDRKLRLVSKYCDNPKEWLHWAKVAFKSSYGYEWQGDNVLIARENLLYSLIDYFSAKFNRNPSLTVQQEFAEIISWNIWQMDGVKYVTPMSCRHINRVILGDLTLFGALPDVVEKDECEGCKFNRPTKHNGRYTKVMDWHIGKAREFIELIDFQNMHEKQVSDFKVKTTTIGK